MLEFSTVLKLCDLHSGVSPQTITHIHTPTDPSVLAVSVRVSHSAPNVQHAAIKADE